ncbi:MAG: ferrochelatase [Planctomycetota bacterium]
MTPAPTKTAKIGVLLVNLGTPDSPDVADVRRYLGEFLMDPRVIDIPAAARWALVHGIILRTRPRKSAAAYREVWGERGSPLRYHGLDLVAGLRDRLGPRVADVALAMRYQNPSIRSALEAFADRAIDDVVVVPLFPQYSQAAWASAYDEVVLQAGRLRNVPTLRFVPPFYDHPAFLDAVAVVAEPALARFGPERVLMSFHGLPNTHIRRSDASGGDHCLRGVGCCEAIQEVNRFCYRAQCFATARGIAKRLRLSEGMFEVTFQSRLTRNWIEPFTDVRLAQLPAEGVRRVAVLCPSFVADCLETLEEVGLRAAASFTEAGGDELLAVPCVNADPAWVSGLAQILAEREPLLATLAEARPSGAAH